MAWRYCKCGNEIDEPDSVDDMFLDSPDECEACGYAPDGDQQGKVDFVKSLIARLEACELKLGRLKHMNNNKMSC